MTGTTARHDRPEGETPLTREASIAAVVQMFRERLVRKAYRAAALSGNMPKDVADCEAEFMKVVLDAVQEWSVDRLDWGKNLEALSERWAHVCHWLHPGRLADFLVLKFGMSFKGKRGPVLSKQDREQRKLVIRAQKYRCVECGVVCNSLGQWETHERGRKHLENIKLFAEAKKECAGASPGNGHADGSGLYYVREDGAIDDDEGGHIVNISANGPRPAALRMHMASQQVQAAPGSPLGIPGVSAHPSTPHVTQDTVATPMSVGNSEGLRMPGMAAWAGAIEDAGPPTLMSYTQDHIASPLPLESPAMGLSSASPLASMGLGPLHGLATPSGQLEEVARPPPPARTNPILERLKAQQERQQMQQQQIQQQPQQVQQQVQPQQLQQQVQPQQLQQQVQPQQLQQQVQPQQLQVQQQPQQLQQQVQQQPQQVYMQAIPAQQVQVQQPQGWAPQVLQPQGSGLSQIIVNQPNGQQQQFAPQQQYIVTNAAGQQQQLPQGATFVTGPGGVLMMVQPPPQQVKPQAVPVHAVSVSAQQQPAQQQPAQQQPQVVVQHAAVQPVRQPLKPAPVLKQAALKGGGAPTSRPKLPQSRSGGSLFVSAAECAGVEADPGQLTGRSAASDPAEKGKVSEISMASESSNRGPTSVQPLECASPAQDTPSGIRISADAGSLSEMFRDQANELQNQHPESPAIAWMGNAGRAGLSPISRSGNMTDAMRSELGDIVMQSLHEGPTLVDMTKNPGMMACDDAEEWLDEQNARAWVKFAQMFAMAIQLVVDEVLPPRDLDTTISEFFGKVNESENDLPRAAKSHILSALQSLSTFANTYSGDEISCKSLSISLSFIAHSPSCVHRSVKCALLTAAHAWDPSQPLPSSGPYSNNPTPMNQ
eukprot:TRINITY_DN7681_c0_g1_i1.p1 TRINITY_DN7681_c0_g1~~TRINITY_DN7681_c0_g1_i1.p1  ORF type:complete len:881 (+),score=203.75 TRINITY_DN7681_c0_g1_i1:127-2769(+)